MENGPADDKVPLLPELESTNKYGQIHCLNISNIGLHWLEFKCDYQVNHQV